VINNQLVYVSKTMYYATLIVRILIYLLLDWLESPYLYGFRDSSALERGRGRLHGGVGTLYVYVQLHRSGFLVRIYAALYVNLYKVGPMWT
jgi:hypothetical protein